MTLLTGHSFDRGFHFNSVDYSGATTNAIDSTYSVDGGYSLRTRTWSADHLEWVRDNFPNNPTQPSTSVYVYAGGYFDDEVANKFPVIRFRLGAGYNIDLKWNTDSHTFDLYLDGALTASGTIEVSTNAWFQVQMHAKIDAATGFVKVFIDGFSSIDYSGDTTLDPSALSYADYCYLMGGIYDLSADRSCFWDNWVLGYNELLGDCHVDEIIPTSDDTVAWSPITGTDNYAMLDEVIPDDDDYNYTETDADVDLFGMEDWDDETASGLTKDPVALVSWIRSKAETATGEAIKVGISSNAVVSEESHNQAVAYEKYEHLDLTDPDTGSDWEKATIDAILLRYESELSA